MNDREQIKQVWKQEYNEAAEAAAKTERSGNYYQAAELWKKAKEKALNLSQKEWCKRRYQYCISWASRREK